MKYFIIIVLTFSLTWFIIKISDKNYRGLINNKIYSQSYRYEIIKNIIPKSLFEKPAIVTQSMKHIQKNMIKVVIHNNKAYWTQDNMFYTADAISGRIDQSTIKQLDIDNMSTKEIEQMMDILDNLRRGEGPNDSSSSGYSGV